MNVTTSASTVSPSFVADDSCLASGALARDLDEMTYKRARTSGAPRKVTLEFLPEDFERIRFSFSSLWECIAAVKAWQDPNGRLLLRPWMTKFESVLTIGRWDSLTPAVLKLLDRLVPISAKPLPRFVDELAALLKTNDKVVRAEIKVCFPERLPVGLIEASERPREFLSKVGELLSDFWRLAVAPEWGLLLSKLESEVMFRSRALLLGGLGELFEGMHRNITYQNGSLTVTTESSAAIEQHGKGLRLIPSIFSYPDTSLIVHSERPPILRYTCRGVGNLWEEAGSQSLAGLKTLVGPSCAKAIRELQTSQTTLEIAKALNLSNAAASEQITKLCRAGLLQRTRVGRLVFYSLNEKGRALLGAFQSD